MADRRPRVAPAVPDITGSLTAGGREILTAVGAPYAETTASQTGITQYLNTGWQSRAWFYFATIGPLNYGLNWLANVMSRVALTVGVVQPGNQEPEILDEGPAVDILNQIKWDESAILRALTIQVSVPGRGYLVGRDIDGIREWKVYSPDQVRPVRGARAVGGWEWELWEYGKTWAPLTDALVAPIRDADDRYDWMDTSTTRSALGILREIELYDKDIVSSLVSRLANNGILLVPQEVTFPTREQYNDNSDPFMMQLIEAARQSIAEPGSASAAIPIPLRVPSQFIDKFRHLSLGGGGDLQKIVADREKALGILADSINLPKEIMTGLGDVSHSAGLSDDLDDAAITNHVSPIAEVLCRGMTRGFLYPQLLDLRVPLTVGGGQIVIWYDTGALSKKPDLSTSAFQLYDRAEIGGTALRRLTGVSDEDAPSTQELRHILLIKAASQPANSLAAIEEITGEPVGEEDTHDAPVAVPPAGDGAIPATASGVPRKLEAVK